MQIGSKLVVMTLIAVLAATTGCAQQPEVIVGKIGLPEQAWGMQTLPFDVTNNTDWLKFLIVETDVAFEGSYVNPHRVVRTNFVLEPLMKLTVDSRLEIPPNYGQLFLKIRIYDVVDTLDNLVLGKVVFEQPFSIRFPAPESVIPYFQDRITLPPLAGEHGLLDNEFSRLMLLMLHEKKTPQEIAVICQTDTTYVREVAERMVEERYLKKEADQYSVIVPIISKEYAEAGRSLADRISDRLTERLTANLANRRTVIDSLRESGIYSGDSTNFTEGGMLLYRPFPLVGGLYLWQVLGQKFVSRSQGLHVFAGTDPCNARIGPYLYLVQGGDYFNGHHFYTADPTSGGYNSQFGDSIPKIDCKPGFDKRPVARESIDWTFTSPDHPDTYLYDSTFINPMLRAIDAGVDEILSDALTELGTINKQFYSTEPTLGTRYWFWNLTASLTLDKMIENGVITRTGNGQFKFLENRD